MKEVQACTDIAVFPQIFGHPSHVYTVLNILTALAALHFMKGGIS